MPAFIAAVVGWGLPVPDRGDRGDRRSRAKHENFPYCQGQNFQNFLNFETWHVVLLNCDA